MTKRCFANGPAKPSRDPRTHRRHASSWSGTTRHFVSPHPDTQREMMRQSQLIEITGQGRTQLRSCCPTTDRATSRDRDARLAQSVGRRSVGWWRVQPAHHRNGDSLFRMLFRRKTPRTPTKITVLIVSKLVGWWEGARASENHGRFPWQRCSLAASRHDIRASLSTFSSLAHPPYMYVTKMSVVMPSLQGVHVCVLLRQR